MADINQTSSGGNGAPTKSNGSRVWIPAIVAILLVIGGVMIARHRSAPAPASSSTTIGVVGSNPEASGAGSSAQAPAQTAAAKALSYSDALVKYKGKIVQFDPSCRATPANQVFKAGTWIMLDNRSASPATVSLAGVRYGIRAYGYRLAKLASVGTFQIDCGNLQNVATVVVER